MINFLKPRNNVRTVDGVRVETVRFDSGDSFVVGDLYLPAGDNADQRYAAAVVAGSLTSVKEMMSGHYARELAKRGVMALAIDYRNFGESGGAARQFEDPALKTQDLSAAAAFLAARKDTAGETAGLLGVCTSGGNVLYAAASDTRVGAVATVAGWFAEPSVAPLLYGGEEGVETRRTAGRAAREKYERTGENEIIPAYHNTDQSASHVGPMEYYMDASRGGGAPEWRNEFAVMSWEPWLDFDPVSHAEKVTQPAFILHSDGSALPDQARKVFDRLQGSKTLHWAEGDHFSFYDAPEKVADAAGRIADHFICALK